MVNDLCLDTRQHLVLRSLTEMPAILTRILEELEHLGYSPKERFGIRLALEEALVNAVKHGNRGDSTKTVQVDYHASDEQFAIEIQDEGPGFRPECVPNPLDPQNLDRPSGRGLLLMEYNMTWVQYNDAGNGVTMCRMRGLGAI